MASDVDAVVILPPASLVPDAAREPLHGFLVAEGLGWDWDDNATPPASELFESEEPTRLCGRGGSCEAAKRLLELAREHSFPVAYHGDWRDGSDEGDVRATIFWYDPETNTEREYPAGSMSFEPIVYAGQLVGLPPQQLIELIAQLTPPACLKVWEAPAAPVR